MDAVAVPVDRGGQACKKLVIRLVRRKIFLCFLLADKGGGGHVWDSLQRGLEGLGLLLRVALVHESRKLIFPLQVPQHMVHIHRHQGEGTHDQQAADDHAYRGKGHKAVGEDAAEAFGEEISEIISLFHRCNTRPSRR